MTECSNDKHITEQINHFAEIKRQMNADGLLPDSLQITGAICRCAVAGKERGKDGSYIIHNDKLIIAWWHNWLTDTTGRYCSKDKAAMTQKERRQLDEHMAQTKRQAREEREAREQEAAQEAAAIWENAAPASEEHGYLAAKGVKNYGLRVDKKGRLLIPLYDENGSMSSLQKIMPQKKEPYPQKTFLTGGRKKGCFFIIKASEKKASEPVLVCEGYATGASLREATGYETWVAFDCGNLAEATAIAMRKYPGRKVCISGDYDQHKDKKMLAKYPEPGGIGAAKAREAAVATGAYLAICPCRNAAQTDFNDLHNIDGVLRVADCIKEAILRGPVNLCPMPKGYLMRKEGKQRGLYWLKENAEGLPPDEIWLAPPIEILGATCTADGDNWGLMLAWEDAAKRKHAWAMPKRLLYAQDGQWLCELADQGWSAHPAMKRQLLQFFSSVNPVKQIECVDRAGWHKDSYILPDKSYGNASENEIVLQSAFHGGLYTQAGNREDSAKLMELCCGNSRLTFAASCALAGTLLEICGIEAGGFSFVGESSAGKTTALRVAASIWGNPKEHLRSWRTTDNALESVAALANDNLLILDELGQAPPKAVSEAAYMLANGTGKMRAKKSGILRKPLSWQAMFLSSGEIGLATKLGEAGIMARAGQQVRLLEIPCCKSHIADLHGFDSSAALVAQIKELANKSYGHTGRMFVEAIAKAERLAWLRENGRNTVDAIAADFCPANADTQAMRAALRFALAAFAGEHAVQMDLLPLEFHALDAARECFEDWMKTSCGVGSLEEKTILEQVSLYIEQYGQSKFQEWSDTEAKLMSRAGFRQEKTFYCLPQMFRNDILKGQNFQQAIRILLKAGWLQQNGKSALWTKRLPGLGAQKVYLLILPEAQEEKKK